MASSLSLFTMTGPDDGRTRHEVAQKTRVDVALVEAGLFESRSKAAEAIAAGFVRVDGVVVAKASARVAADAVVEASAPYPWVSRGGVKLTAGLNAFGLDPSGRCCLDIGASTGGFTQVLLARGAPSVTAIDVGHGQFHSSLRDDPRVILQEGADARSWRPDEAARLFDLIVCDVSFISLRLILPPVLRLAAARAEAVILIKPQFEAGPARVRKGVVRDPAVHELVCRGIEAVVQDLGWAILGVVPSPIEGGDGNREFLLGARRA